MRESCETCHATRTLAISCDPSSCVFLGNTHEPRGIPREAKTDRGAQVPLPASRSVEVDPRWPDVMVKLGMGVRRLAVELGDDTLFERVHFLGPDGQPTGSVLELADISHADDDAIETAALAWLRGEA